MNNNTVLLEEFISYVSKESGIPKCKAKAAIKAFPIVITNLLREGKTVKLQGVGNFYPKTLPSMDVVNPANPTEFRHIEERVKLAVDLSETWEASLGNNNDKQE